MSRKMLPIFLGAILVISMSIQIASQSYSFYTSQNSTDLEQAPIISQSDYENPIYGAGNDRDVFIFMQNASTANGINEFNVSTDNDDTFLNGGQFNLTLDPTYNTTYTLEDDNSLEYDRYHHDVSIASEDVAIDTGANASSSGDFIRVDSAIDGSQDVVKLSFLFNATGMSTSIAVSSILGFKIAMDFLSTKDLLVNTSAKNVISTTYDILNSTNYVAASLNYYSVSYEVINQNINYFNSSRCAEFELVFYNISDSFQLSLDSLSVSVIQGHEKAIYADRPVALEFDLKGDSIVYGFQAWIRPKNIEFPTISNLTIQLFESTYTGNLTRSQLLDPQSVSPLATPSSNLIATHEYLNFDVDGPHWFTFWDNGTGIELPIGNYFIVISANTSNTIGEKRFSLVTIPWTSLFSPFDPDNMIDHLLLINDGVSWLRAKTNFTIGNDKPIVDASNFALNMTRGYLPSELGLEIDGVPVQDAYVWDYPHDTFEDSDPDVRQYAAYWWGYGNVSLDFTSPIPADNGNFNVSLSWDPEVYEGNLPVQADYIVERYYTQAVSSYFTLETDKTPAWNMTLAFDANNVLFDNWNFTKSAFTTPDDWELSRIEKIGTDITSSLEDISDKDGFTYFTLNSSVVDQTGEYSLFAESPNYIKSAETYLAYGDTQWKTNGFMAGDSVELSAALLSSEGNYLEKPGKITANLYNTTGDLLAAHTITDMSIDDNSSYSWFDFDGLTLWETSELDPLGTYHIILNWTDGDQVGIMEKAIYLNHYSAQIRAVSHLEDTQTNQIFGTVGAFDTDLGDYDLLVYAIKPLTSTTEEFLINETRDIAVGDSLQYTGYALNETVINPNENVSLLVELENTDLFLDYNVSVVASLVYATNTDWVVTNTTSTGLLAMAGQPDGSDIQNFTLTLSVPSLLDGGLNCPLRNMPMQISLAFLVDGEIVDQYTEASYLYFSRLNESFFEGKVLTSRLYEGRSSPSFLSNIARSNLDLPGDVFYFAQVYNDYYMALGTEANYTTFNNLLDSVIDDFSAESNPVDYVANQTISGVIIDENSDYLANTEIHFYFDNQTNASAGNPIWVPITSTSGTSTIDTDEDGHFEFEFAMEQVPFVEEISIMAKFEGNATHCSFNETLAIQINQYNSSVSISVNDQYTLIKGEHNLVAGTITNNGNSTLKNISLGIASPYKAQIYIEDGLSRLEIAPGETYTFQIDFYDTDYPVDTLAINITLSAQVAETALDYENTQNFDLKAYRVNQINVVATAFLIIFFVGVVGLWLYSAKHIKTKIDEINAPVEEEIELKSKKSKRKGGKYVNIADLSKDQEKAKKPKDGTSLDELLDKED